MKDTDFDLHAGYLGLRGEWKCNSGFPGVDCEETLVLCCIMHLLSLGSFLKLLYLKLHGIKTCARGRLSWLLEVVGQNLAGNNFPIGKTLMHFPFHHTALPAWPFKDSPMLSMRWTKLIIKTVKGILPFIDPFEMNCSTISLPNGLLFSAIAKIPF